MKKINRWLQVMTASAVLVASGAAMAKDYSEVRIATEGAYKPYNFKDASGNLIGFEIDLANDLCQRMQVKCTLVEQAWDGIIPSLVSGRYDAIMAGMSVKPKREKVISFSHQYIHTPIRFIVKKNGPLADFKSDLEFVTLDNLSADENKALDQLRAAFKGKKVGVGVSTTQEDFMKTLMPDIRISSYDKVDNMVLDLNSGRVDIVMAAMSFIKPLLEKPDGADLTAIGPGLTRGPLGQGVAVGIRKEDGELRDMFSKAIKEALDDGTVRKMAIQWFGFDNSVKP